MAGKLIEVERKFPNSCNLFEFVRKCDANWLINNIDTYPCRESSDKNYDSKKVCVNYCKEILNSTNGNIKRSYYNNDGLGRMYLKKGQEGFQTLMREYRAFLCYRNYYDLDIKNAQPSILLSICKEKEIDHYYLEKYVLEREERFEEFKKLNKKLDKDTFKMFFISIMNGSKNDGEKKFKLNDKARKFIKKFTDEMIRTREILFKEKENLVFVAQAESKKNYNIDGTAMAYYLQNQENVIIQLARKYLSKKGYEIGALVFDGLMIRNNIPLTPKIIEDLNKYIFKSTKLKIEFLIKPFDVKYIPDDDELVYKDEVIVLNDAEASKIILNELNNDIIKCDSKYFYRKFPNTNIYVEDKSSSHKETMMKLFSIIMNYDIKIVVGNNIKDYSKKTSGCKNICEAVISNLPNNMDFMKKLFNSNLGKLCFLNGYYDIKDNQFKNYDENCYTLKYIEKEYVDEIDEKYTNLLNEKILYPILGQDKEKRKIMFRWFSRALFGCMDKRWAIGLANRDTGKSLLTALFEISFNSYVKVFSSENLLLTKNSGDVAKKLSWIVPFEHARLYLGNEMKTEDENNKKSILDGNLIKSIASGGDTKEARQNYENERTFKLQGMMCAFMNELTKISHSDALQNLDQFSFDNIFVKELTDEHKNINENGEGCKYFLADENVKEIIKDENIQNAFIKIIIQNYGESIKNIVKNDFDENENDFRNKIDDYFEFTLSKKDRIPVKNFNDILSENCLIASKSAIKLFLEKKGIGNAVFPNEGRVYTGIKIKAK